MNESARLAWCRQQLVEATQLLAADFAGQVAALPSFVHVPDEVLLHYDDAFLLMPQVLEAGLITAEQAAVAEAMHQALDTISVPQDYAVALRALEHAPEWAALRAQARALLKALDEPLRAPEFSQTVYVSSGHRAL